MEVKAYQIIDGKKVEVREEIISHTYTEHSLQLSLLGELYFRMFAACRLEIDHSQNQSTFLNGAKLRLILDSAAILLMLVNFNEETQKRFIQHFKEGKPNDKFFLFWYEDSNGKQKKQYLTNGYMRKFDPTLNNLYEALNNYSHPSKVYYDKIVKLEGNNLFINREVPTIDITELGSKIYDVFTWVYNIFDKQIRSIEPKSDKYRIVYYSDTVLEYAGKEPVPIKVYEY